MRGAMSKHLDSGQRTPYVFQTAAVILILAISFAACAPPPLDGNAGDPPPPDEGPAPAVEVSATATSAPLVFALAGTTLDPGADGLVEEIVSAIAAERGWAFRRAANPDLAAYLEGADYLIALGAVTGLSEWMGRNPAASVLAIGPKGETAESASVLRPAEGDFWRLGFMAGYLAAAVTDEWRIGLLTGESAETDALEDGLRNGMRYFCGLCQQYFPPFLAYPLVARLAPGSGEAEVSGAINEVLARQVATVVVGPGAEAAEMPAKAAGLTVLGLATAEEGDWRDGGASLTIPADLVGLAAAVREWLNGGEVAGGQFTWAIHLYSTNPGVVSPGKLEMAAQVIPGLLDGTIHP
jgi:hypothetical protein